ILIIVVFGAAAPVSFGKIANILYDFTQINSGWFYLLTVFSLIVFLIGLTLSKYGAIRLGGDDSEPDYPFFTWIGMLFSPSFGPGLVFWGGAEPMSHYFISPTEGVADSSAESARIAMGYSFFHW